jgi:hypothetical protein
MTDLYENIFTYCLKKKEIIVDPNNRYCGNQRLKNVGDLKVITERKIKCDFHVLVGKIIRECIVTENVTNGRKLNQGQLHFNCILINKRVLRQRSG